MKKLRHWIVLPTMTTILLATSSIAGKKPNFQACYDKADTTIAMRKCSNREYSFHDGRLNKLYGQLLKKTDQKAKLKAAQRAWLAFRDKDCDFSSAPYSDGTIYPQMMSQCKIKHTKRRVADLASELKSAQQ